MPRNEGHAMKDEVKAFRKPQQPKSKSTKKSAPKPRPVAAVPKDPEPLTVPLALQQRVLDVFHRALYTGPESLACVQEVKAQLYKRDFGAAFGREEFLRAYGLRWSAGRTLGYLDLLCGGIGEVVLEGLVEAVGRTGNDDAKSRRSRVLCLGAGAGAEIAAFAGWMKGSESDDSLTRLTLETVDIAAWDGVVDALVKGVTSSGGVSSEATKQSTEAMVEADEFSVSFTRSDLLEWDEATTKQKLEGVQLVTIMFTLNELYSTSLAKTQNLLASLTAGSACGTMLLVVDSPGSYSTVSVNNAEKKYPMQWLLEYALLGSKKSNTPAKWEKVTSEDSKWFRLPDGLVYPIELENMRYQVHLYRRVDDSP